MASWAHVKFVLDGTVVNVSTAAFQKVVDGELEPTDLKVDSIYWVFWSPEESDTPLTMSKKGNKIVQIDDLLEKERERRKKSNGGPLKGYYKALLLDLQGSEGMIVANNYNLKNPNFLE